MKELNKKIKVKIILESYCANCGILFMPHETHCPSCGCLRIAIENK